MLKFITNLFAGKKHEAPTAPTPYKVETPVVESKPAPKAKKPAVKKATTRKPKTAKTPKA